MAKSWKKSDLTYLRRQATKRTVADLARRFGVGEPEIRSKLQELGLESADGSAGTAGGFQDPALPRFEAALEALSGGKIETAAELFAEVARTADQMEVRERARLYLAVARRRLDGEGAGVKDPYLEAVLLRNGGRLGEALDRCEAKAHQDDERFAYLAAGILAEQGDLDQATERLRRAIELNPKNRVHAFHDTDFLELRRSQRHRAIFDA